MEEILIDGRKKKKSQSRYRVLTSEQLKHIIQEYNRPSENGMIKTVKFLAEEMDVPVPLVMEGIGWLRKSNAKIDHIKKDEHYKMTIKALLKSDPQLFEKK